MGVPFQGSFSGVHRLREHPKASSVAFFFGAEGCFGFRSSGLGIRV